jgi:hypothetical protein
VDRLLVPEPHPLLGSVTGLLMLGALARRRRNLGR